MRKWKWGAEEAISYEAGGRGQGRQDQPKTHQERAKSGQERPKSGPKAILEASWLVLGRVWAAKTLVFLWFFNTFCKTMVLR